MRYVDLFKKHEETIDEAIDMKYMDIDLNSEVQKRKKNLELFEKIVGEKPFQQIDWIIENGFEKYCYWYTCYEIGTIYTPATVCEYKEPVLKVAEVRGGQGNKVLLCWEYS